MEDFWKDAHVDGGYELLYTPHIANLDLWKVSAKRLPSQASAALPCPRPLLANQPSFNS